MTAPPIIARGLPAGSSETSTQSPREKLRGRLTLASVALALAAAITTLVLLQPATSIVPFAPDSPEPDGARAAAQILTEQGVDITYVRTTAAAIAAAEPNSTLLIFQPNELNEDQQEALAEVPSDIVLADLTPGRIAHLTNRIRITEYSSRQPLQDDCQDPDADAAGQILAGGAAITGDVTTCFHAPEGAMYATWTESGQVWRAFSDGMMLSNSGLAEHGNAALVFRALGAHDRLIWYLPSPGDPFTPGGPVQTFPIPEVALWYLVLLGVVLVLWRGRRLGPVVLEPLPVVVKATETTRGRGRLYRRAHAHAHAGSALRAGFLARVCGPLGIPGHAPPEQVIDTLARASGRDPAAISDVLYGPPPSNDSSLIALTQALDTLESELQPS
ncbi:MAG: DUF4350 domain-containing protein [Beutenbergiaceae bacterium]